VVSNGDREPLKRTIASIKGVRENSLAPLRVVVKALPRIGSIETLADDLATEIDVLLLGPDCGVYDGMNQMLQSIRSSFVLFLNSGDALDVASFCQVARRMDSSARRVLYSDVIEQGRGVVRSRLWPLLLKMPHHQGMIIPGSFFLRTGYRFPDYLRIAGDLDLKMALLASRYRFERIDVPFVICEPAGLSGLFRFSNVFQRAREMSLVGATRVSIFVAPVFFVIYATWYLIRAVRAAVSERASSAGSA
jgi:hypothetical protein